MQLGLLKLKRVLNHGCPPFPGYRRRYLSRRQHSLTSLRISGQRLALLTRGRGLGAYPYTQVANQSCSSLIFQQTFA